MEDSEYLFDLINKSNISLLGYTFKEERIKDEIISKVPHIELPEINSSFSMLSFIRDSKIDLILNNTEERVITHFLLDINNFMVGKGNISRANVIKNSLQRIAEEVFNTGFKLLITSPMYNNLGKDEYDFSGGNTGLYISDFVGIIKKDCVKIMKNRHGYDQINIKL